MAADAASAERLGRELEALLEVEKFPPPEDFRRQALVSDWSLHEEAERDLEGFWARQAEELLDWYEKPQRTLNESDAPFYRWFEGGKLNVSYNCLDRHVEAGNGDKVAFHWRADGGVRLRDAGQVDELGLHPALVDLRGVVVLRGDTQQGLQTVAPPIRDQAAELLRRQVDLQGVRGLGPFPARVHDARNEGRGLRVDDLEDRNALRRQCGHRGLENFGEVRVFIFPVGSHLADALPLHGTKRGTGLDEGRDERRN